MKRLLLTLISINILYICCQKQYSQNTEINNILKDETIILKKLSNQNTIHSLSINLDGNIEGKARITLISGP